MPRLIASSLFAAFVVYLLWTACGFAEESKPVVLKPGDKAPRFSGRTDENKPWKSADHVGKKLIVLYFYPKDMTPGCTKQACTYRDMKKEFTDNNIQIIGVSGDTVASHRKFKKEHDLNFTLLADPRGEIAKAFGVKLLAGGDSIVTARWTFVIDRDGVIVYKNDAVDAAKDGAAVLKAIDEHENKKG